MKATQKNTNSPMRLLWRRFAKKRVSVMGMGILIFMALVGIFAPFIAPHGPDEQKIKDAFSAPSLQYPFGTDNLGRDVLSRVIYGTRISLSVGFISVAIAFVLGCPLGLIAGFFGGKVETIIMRIMDVFLAIPNMLLAIAISAALGTGVGKSMLAVGIAYMPVYARMMRATSMTIKNEEFIEAARANNSNNWRIMIKHIFPNAISPLIVQTTLGVAHGILMISSLSFIGLGVQPPTPEWGSMLAAGRAFLRNNPWLCTFPGIAIMLSVLSFNLMGDGLRDATDPRLKN